MEKINKTVDKYLKEVHLERFNPSPEVEDMLYDFAKQFHFWDMFNIKKIKYIDKDNYFTLRRWADEYGSGEMLDHEMRDRAKQIKSLFM